MLNANADQTMPTDNLPEKLILRLEFDMDQEWAVEMFKEQEDGTEPMSLQMFIDNLRIAAEEYLRDDLFNMIQSAKIVDENENVIFSDEEDEDEDA